MKTLIIGAGPGGLAVAVNLAGLGAHVVVVEKEAVPGGRMRGLTFGSQGEYRVDTGPSIMQLPQLLERIFRRSGLRIEDYVTLQRLDVNTRVCFWDGTHLDTTWDQPGMQAEVERLVPGKGGAYRRWFLANREKYAVAHGMFMAHPADSLAYYAPLRLLPAARFKPWQTLYAHLDETFHDDRLTYAFSYPSKYLGLHPTTCSSVFSIIPYLELEFGVWHVMGGFQALAQGMMKAAQDLGAEFRMSSPVARVLVENQRAVGVELESGEKLVADVVVVNADLPYAATTLIDERWRRGTRLSDQALGRAKYSCSTFMLYLGLDTVYRDLPHHLIYLSNAARRTDRDALEDRYPNLDDPPFCVLNPHVTRLRRRTFRSSGGTAAQAAFRAQNAVAFMRRCLRRGVTHPADSWCTPCGGSARRAASWPRAAALRVRREPLRRARSTSRPGSARETHCAGSSGCARRRRTR
jgi:phytoene desaturase